MILYKNDWGRHPEAIVHTNTTNKSFIKMHHILKDMGISNNAFFLALHQPELRDINPFDLESISPVTAVKIGVECKINPWYFIREIVRLPATGTDPIPFKFNRAVMFIYWSFFNSINSLTIQPRQTGKTITSESLVAELLYFVYINTRIKLFTHSNELIHENVSKLKSIRDELPSYLIDINKSKDTDNKEEVCYGALNNTYVTKTAQQSVAGAFNAGRGGTVLVNQFDEAPFCPNIRISYPVLMNAKLAAVRHAKENGIPHADIMTTTAGKLDTDSGEYIFDILNKCLVWNERLLDLSSNADLRHLLKNNSRNNMLYAEFSYRQLEFTPEWAAEVIRENNLEGDAVDRDIYNIWTVGSGSPVVDIDLLNKVNESKTYPVATTIHEDYRFNWYEEESEVWKDPKRFFVIGMDTSDNIGEDFTTVHMLDISDLATIMTSRCNDQELTKLSSYIARLLIAHPNVVLVPERKSTASVLISLISADLWKANINPYTRIYNRIFQNRQDSPYDKMDVNTTYASQGPMKKYLGYPTSPTGENSRNALYKLTLNTALKSSWSVIRDINLINEFRGLTLNPNSKRIDHRTGMHDDSVVAYLLAAWFVIHGRNHYLYGIPNYLKMSKIISDMETIDVSKRDRQREVTQRVKRLKLQIKSTTNSVVRMDLLQELGLLQSQLDSLGAEIGDIETIADKQHVNVGIDHNEFIRGINDTPYMHNFRSSVNDPFKRNGIWDKF